MAKKNYRSGFRRIDALILQSARSRHLEGALYRHKVLRSWQDIASGFLEEAKELSQAVDLKNGVLTIACLSRELAARIKLLARRIIAAINQMLGRAVVYAIAIEV